MSATVCETIFQCLPARLRQLRRTVNGNLPRRIESVQMGNMTVSWLCLTVLLHPFQQPSVTTDPVRHQTVVHLLNLRHQRRDILHIRNLTVLRHLLSELLPRSGTPPEQIPQDLIIHRGTDTAAALLSIRQNISILRGNRRVRHQISVFFLKVIHKKQRRLCHDRKSFPEELLILRIAVMHPQMGA